MLLKLAIDVWPELVLTEASFVALVVVGVVAAANPSGS
jgi:hypothetical protein